MFLASALRSWSSPGQALMLCLAFARTPCNPEVCDGGLCFAQLEQSGTGIDHDTCWLFVRLPDVMTDIFYWDSTSTVAGKLKKALEKHGW